MQEAQLFWHPSGHASCCTRLWLDDNTSGPTVVVNTTNPAAATAAAPAHVRAYRHFIPTHPAAGRSTLLRLRTRSRSPRSTAARLGITGACIARCCRVRVWVTVRARVTVTVRATLGTAVANANAAAPLLEALEPPPSPPLPSQSSRASKR